MRRVLSPLLMLLLLAMPAGAAERPQGLLWNRSGLPATLPLQVRTGPGQDYLLHLRDTATGRDVMAAYIRGGEFFRLMVPPGRYRLVFASGSDWQSEDKLFGSATKVFALDTPLTFAATLSRKEGHEVDLRDPTTAAFRDLAICQHLLLQPESLDPPQPPEGEPRVFPKPRYDLMSWYCD